MAKFEFMSPRDAEALIRLVSHAIYTDIIPTTPKDFKDLENVLSHAKSIVSELEAILQRHKDKAA